MSDDRRAEKWKAAALAYDGAIKAMLASDMNNDSLLKVKSAYQVFDDARKFESGEEVECRNPIGCPERGERCGACKRDDSERYG